MTMLHPKGTVSMILTLPDIKESTSLLAKSIENLNQNPLSSLINQKPLSIPIYHGSICRIEQHEDNVNLCDLIVRVPNVNYSSLPLINLSNDIIGDDQLNDINIRHETPIKRRAPICPILKNSLNHALSSNQNQTDNVNNSNPNQPEINLPLINTKRLTIGLRNLSRAFTANCKSKPSSNINEIAIIPILPDVEVITESFPMPKQSKKPTKTQNSTSKFTTPKIFLIKRKYLRLKRKQVSSVPINIENEAIHININDNKTEQQNESKQTVSIPINNQIEEQTKLSDTVTTNDPILVKSPESSSKNAYTSIPQLPLDSQIQIKDNNINKIAVSIEMPTNMIQTSSTFMPKEKFCLIANDINSLVHNDNEEIKDNDSDIEERLYIVHPNGDTFSECYEVTYEFDPQYKSRLNIAQEQIDTPIIEDQSSVKFNIDSSEYEDLRSTVTNFPKITSNNYNEIGDDHIGPSCQQPPSNNITDVTRVKFHPTENSSQIINHQPTIYQSESISTFSPIEENDQVLCHGDTPIIYEDYTIILQILKNVLQIDQLLQTESTDEFKQK